jgi:16S rRNA (cytosine1402-N4)-methyltransferase
MNNFHIPVLLKETIEYLDVKKDQWYIDCNLGGGGHTASILEQGGKVLGIDLDKDALEESAKRFNLNLEELDEKLIAKSEKLILIQDNFINLKSLILNLNIPSVAGILFDLGISSHQLDDRDRGFSFMDDAPLDMRMNRNSIEPTAADIVNALSQKELTELFFKFGEEPRSRRIAEAITEYKKHKLIQTTHELTNIVLSVKPRTRYDRIHPATQVFQALRIITNDELNNLKIGLENAMEVLEKDGRLVIISFHSLEDRIVKNFIRDKEHEEKLENLTKKPVEATLDELYDNSRARSAKLRAATKIKGDVIPA